MKYLFVALLLTLLPVTAFAEDTAEDSSEDQLISLTEERRDTLKYGIDSEIISLLDALKDEEDKILADVVAEVYAQTVNSDIMNSAVDYFISIDYGDATKTAEKIIENREDESYYTLSPSLKYLSHFPDDNTEDLILPLADHDNKTLAISALTALGKCGTEKSVDPLLDMLDNDDYPDELKPTVIKALGEIGSDKALDILIYILEDIDEEKSWRWNACEALGRIADADALPAIKDALQDKDTYLRSYAVKALAGFDGSDVEETLIQSLRDSFWRVRVSAAEALGERKSKAAVDILMYKAKKDPEKNVKLAAVEALGEIADSKSLDFLRELYRKNTTAPSIRTKAAEIIIEKDTAASIDTVTAVLAEEWEKDTSAVLSYTCKFLSKAREPRLETLFERMLNYNDVAIKIYGIRGIQLNKFAGMKERLESLTKEGVNNSVRKAALAAIEQL